jgi:hypothetical protein
MHNSFCTALPRNTLPRAFLHEMPQFAQAESAALERPYPPLADAILARMGLSLDRPVVPSPSTHEVGSL